MEEYNDGFDAGWESYTEPGRTKTALSVNPDASDEFVAGFKDGVNDARRGL